MIKHYLHVGLRALGRHKGYTFVNVAGLALGLACCLLILLFVRDEHAYDRFHTNADRLYRLNKVVTPQEGGTERHAISSGLMGPTLAADYAQVEDVVRVLPWFDDVLLRVGDETAKVSDVVLADANFFELFDFRLLRGDPTTVLEPVLSIVLTETTARRLFGDEDPVGRTVTGLNDLEYTVTGLAEDPPEHAHLRFNALISWSSTVPGNGALEMGFLNNWLTQALFTYILLAPDADPEALTAQLPDFMQRNFPQRAEQYHLYLQPFTDIYLGSSDLLYVSDLRLGNRTYVYVLSIIAVLILLIACINYMNLATARATRRTTEVGIRKVIGANRTQLARQFLGESVLVVLLALGVAVALVEAVRPAFNHFTGKHLTVDLVNDPWLLAGLAGLVLVVGLVSGLYPALVLSRFQPVQVLKDGAYRGAGGFMLRRVLVVVQFAISITLIIGSLAVYRQMTYLQSTDLGYQRDQLVVLPVDNTTLPGQFEAVKAALLQHPQVTHVTGSSAVPGQATMGFGIVPEGRPADETWTTQTIRVDDYDLIETYGMEMAAGRYFSDDFATDATNGVVINEAMVRALGWTDPVGKRLDIPGEVDEGTVIGVVNDFHYASLHQTIQPLALYMAPRWDNLTIRITGRDVPGTLAHLQDTWERFEPQYPFEYFFLDASFAALYQTEERLMETLGLFTLLALFIAALGLFGLAAFTAEQRTKEVGIRKVMGATVMSLVVLLSKTFVRLVVLAFVVAAPLAYFITRFWLSSFAYRVELSWWTFLLAGLTALGIALLTVSYQAIKVALSDPVKSLRYE